jgi:rhodanese-related sulfurtransferase
MRTAVSVPEIQVEELKQRLDDGDNVFLLDVRDEYEYEISNIGDHLIPLAQLPKRPESVPSAVRRSDARRPDPALLARMANEFFTALPGSLDVPAASLPVDAPPDFPATASSPATVPATRPEASLPSDKHLPGLPASLGPATVAPASIPVQAGPPAVPGAICYHRLRSSPGAPSILNPSGCTAYL